MYFNLLDIRNKEFLWHLFLLMMFVILLLNNMECMATSSDIKADHVGDDFVINQNLCKIINLLTGKLARSLSVIAVFVSGVGAMLGKISWMAIAILFGAIFSTLGAVQIISWLAGTSAAC